MFPSTSELRRPATAVNLTIGRLADLTGCSVPTIRYYEQLGLPPPPQRRSSGHRAGDTGAVSLLSFIRQCRELDFSIDYLRSLLALSADGASDCTQVRDIAQARLDAVRANMAQLQMLEASLAQVVDACNSNCCSGPAPACTIFRDLALLPAAG